MRESLFKQHLTKDKIDVAHLKNNMFYAGKLNTGHNIYARIEKTNYFEGEKNYTNMVGFNKTLLQKTIDKEQEVLGFIPERMCKPEDKPRVKYKKFYENNLISKLTNILQQTLVICVDTEYYHNYVVEENTGEIILSTYEQEEVVRFLKETEYTQAQNYEILTSMSLSMVIDNYFCTFNVLVPMEYLNDNTTIEKLPKVNMEELLTFIFEMLGVNLGAQTKDYIEKGKLKRKSKALQVVLLAHNGRAEWNKFEWFETFDFDKYGNMVDGVGQTVMNYVSNIQGGDISVNTFNGFIHRSKNILQNCVFTFSDTMSLTDPNHKKLKDLGKIIGMGLETEKVSISKDNLQHMNAFLVNEPEKYIEYSIQDTIVPLVYVATLYGVNKAPDITLLTGGQRVVNEQLKNNFKTKASKYLQSCAEFVFNEKITDQNGKPLRFTDKKKNLTNEALDIIYRGLVPEHKNTKNSELPLYEKKGLVAINTKMRDLLLMAQRSYKGGENFCSCLCTPETPKNVGEVQTTRAKTRRKPKRNSVCVVENVNTFFSVNNETLFYDLDIPSAYPTSIFPICAVNVLEPIACQSNKLITFDGATKKGKKKFNDLKRSIVKKINEMNLGYMKPLKSFDLGIPGFVEIEECITPKGVRPLLSAKLKGENIPINPQHFKIDGNVVSNSNTFTFLELQQLIDLGCTVVVSKIVIANPVIDDNGDLFRPLGDAVVEIIQLRKEMAKLYGKKSLPALICKLIANGVYYGKTAQNCIPTKTFSPIENEEESIDRGPSNLTQPIYASYITAGTRCILSSAGYGMFKHGYIGWLSQTTDGGITTVPEFLVNKWSDTTIAEYFKNVRAELSLLTEGKEDNRLLVVKHISQELYNFTTRGNVGFCNDKELQVPVGYKYEKDKNGGYVYEPYYVEHLLSETETQHIKETVGEDYIVEGVCACQGFKSEYGYEKGSEEYKLEIVNTYLVGMRRMQINTYKPESLTQKQKQQIKLPNEEQREWPMSTTQKSFLKMNFDYKQNLIPENFEEVEVSNMFYAVGWTTPFENFEEAMAFRKFTKNMKRCIRNAVDLEYVQEKVKGYKPITKRQMRLFLEGYKLGVFGVIPVLDELQGQERLEFINDFIKGDEMTLKEMLHCYELERCLNDENEICYESQLHKFDQTIQTMLEVGKY